VSQSQRPIGDSLGSRVVHSLQSLSARAAASALAAAASIVVLVWALASGRPDRIVLWFEGVATAVTLVMVFVLQHTQTRQQLALQHKLDEILHALPEADSRLISLESASVEDIAAVEQRHSALRDEAQE
jgi:low affinity Fe/Cu permease